MAIDKTVASAEEAVADIPNGATLAVVAPGPGDTASHHVIAGDILSPGMTAEVARLIGDWVAARL